MSALQRKGHVGRTIVYLPTSERPVPNLFTASPKPRPNCALSNRVLEGGGGVCYGPGAIHDPRCPMPPRKGAQWERHR